MGKDQPETAVYAKKPRADRKRELEALLEVPDGIKLLAHLYKAHFRVPPGSDPPAGTIMVARLLSLEYPDG
jgi:hypothetical protein